MLSGIGSGCNMTIDSAGKLRANQKQVDKVGLILDMTSEIKDHLDKKDSASDMFSKLKTRVDLIILLVLLQTVLILCIR